MGAPEVNQEMESPAAVKIPGAGVVHNEEKAHGVPEAPAPVEAAEAPIEQYGTTARGADLPASSLEAVQAPVEQNGEKSQGPTEPLALVEAPYIPVEQNGEKLRGATVSVQPPKAIGGQNSKKSQGATGLTASVETPKTVGKQNGQKAGGSVETLENVEVPKSPVDDNVEKLGGSAAEPASVVSSEASIEQSSGAEEFDNAEMTNKDQNSSSLWSSGATNGSWETAENHSVLGPGPFEAEKSVQPAPAKQLYTYYMIRIPKFADLKGKTEIRMADSRVKELTEKRDFINAALQMRRANRTEALHKLRTAREKVRSCSDAVRQKKDELSPLQGALRKLRNTGRQARDKSRDLPASEQELDEKIAYCEYRIQHESIPLKEEKQLLRDIKSLKASREAVCANEALHAEFSESLGEQDGIQERLKPLISELESLKTQWTIATETCKVAEAEFEEKDTAFSQVQEQWNSAHQSRNNAYSELSSLTKQDNAQSNEFYQNRREIQHVRQLAFKKDRKAVEELCNAQVERVMAVWNGNPEYRATYVKSNERSTLKRLQTFDGRALGPDEEPPLIPGDSDGFPSETQTDVGSFVNPAKSQREVPAASDNSVLQTADSQRKGKHWKSPGFVEPNRQLSSSNAAAGMEVVLNGQEEEEKEEQDSPGAARMDALLSGQEEKGEEDSAAAAKLKQLRREEEMAKAKIADERKRKAAERLQSKALAKARKEAERQEKEKEKRSQKKAARLANSSEIITPVAEIGLEAAHEVEKGLDPVKECAPKSGPTSRHSKRPPSQISNTMKTPLDSSLGKKVSKRPLTLFWGVGLVGLLAILAFIAMVVYNS